MLITEQELARERDEQRKPISLEEKHENFIGSSEKMGNASGHQSENKQQCKTKQRNTCDISSIKRVIRKFLEVSRCSHA